jgi:hypothetical protein
MSYEQVAERIKTLPENYLTSIMGFIDLLQSHDESEQKSESNIRKFGCAKNELQYPDDIDFCNEEIAQMFGVDE